MWFSMEQWKEAIHHSVKQHGLSRNTFIVIFCFPCLISFGFALALTIPTTRQFAKGLLVENQPIELLTTVFMLIATVFAAQLVRHYWREQAPTYISIFYALFGIGLFVVGMEEIAWGQWLFGFETPEAIKEINEQDELTLHNIQGLHGRTEILRLIFGIGGIIGCGLSSVQVFHRIAPPMFLISWFLVITGLAIPDFLNDLIDVGTNLDAIFDFLSEVNEFLVASVSLLFVWYTRPWSSSKQ